MTHANGILPLEIIDDLVNNFGVEIDEVEPTPAAARKDINKVVPAPAQSKKEEIKDEERDGSMAFKLDDEEKKKKEEEDIVTEDASLISKTNN